MVKSIRILVSLDCGLLYYGYFLLLPPKPLHGPARFSVRHPQAGTFVVVRGFRLSTLGLDGGDVFCCRAVWALGMVVSVHVIGDTGGSKIPELG